MAFLEEYTLLDKLGQGGYASVYKVRHNNLGYIRALRVLDATIALGEQDELYQKFLEECRLLLRLGNGNHPNIVHIYQPLLKAQKAIVEMDFVDGKDLSHYIKDCNHFVETKDVLKLLDDIGSALAYCHEDIYKSCMDREEDGLKDDPNDGSKVLLDDKTKQRLINKYRVIHNDIHSGNIIRRENGSYVLLDFGLAIEGDDVVRSSRRKNGAPEFKAPEKWDNDSILTTQSDIYSFGVVLYDFLAGRAPFPFDKSKNNVIEAEYLLGQAHKKQKIEPIFELRKAAFEASHPGQEYEKDYPDWLEQVIMKCLEKSPNDRFKNGKELHDFVLEHIDDKDKAKALATEKESSELRKQISNLEHRLVVLQEKADSTTSDSEAQEFIKQLRSQLKALTTTNKELEEKISGLERAAQESPAASQGVEQSGNKSSKLLIIALLISTIVCLAGALYLWLASPTSISKVALLELQLDKKESIISSLEQSTDNLEKKVALNKNTIDSLTTVLTSKNEEISQLKAGNSSSSADQKKIKDLNKQIKTKDDKISELNKEIKRLNAQKTANNDDKIKALNSKIKAKDAKISELNKEITSLKNKIEKLLK